MTRKVLRRIICDRPRKRQNWIERNRIKRSWHIQVSTEKKVIHQELNERREKRQTEDTEEKIIDPLVIISLRCRPLVLLYHSKMSFPWVFFFKKLFRYYLVCRWPVSTLNKFQSFFLLFHALPPQTFNKDLSIFTQQIPPSRTDLIQVIINPFAVLNHVLLAQRFDAVLR